MTAPLKYVGRGSLGGDLEQMITGDFDRFRYNLRVRFAEELLANEVGSIVVTTGNGIGTATDTVSFAQTINHPQRRQPPPGIGTTRNVRNYSQFSTGTPGFPTDFSESYVAVSDTQDDPTGFTLEQQDNIVAIRELILTPCIEQMRTGDMVGSYMAAVSSPQPASEWTRSIVLFQDTVFAGATTTTYLWIKTSVTNPPGSATMLQPLKHHAEGLEQHSMAEGSSFENFMYDLLRNRLTQGDLTYVIGTAEPTTIGLLNRGMFMDTRRTQSTPGEPGPGSGDDYRSSSTPSGPAFEQEVYYLGMT